MYDFHLLFHTMVIDQLVDHPDVKKSYFFLQDVTRMLAKLIVNLAFYFILFYLLTKQVN